MQPSPHPPTNIIVTSLGASNASRPCSPKVRLAAGPSRPLLPGATTSFWGSKQPFLREVAMVSLSTLVPGAWCSPKWVMTMMLSRSGSEASKKQEPLSLGIHTTWSRPWVRFLQGPGPAGRREWRAQERHTRGRGREARREAWQVEAARAHQKGYSCLR